MPLSVFIAEVIWPGKEFEDKFNPGQQKVNATLKRLGDSDDEKIYINSKPGTRKAERLKALTKGGKVAVVFVDMGQKSWYDLADFDDHIKGKLTAGAGDAPVGAKPVEEWDEAVIQARAETWVKCYRAVYDRLMETLKGSGMTDAEALAEVRASTTTLFIEVGKTIRKETY